MGRIKTIAATCLFLGISGPAFALDALSHQFATCTGRLSAELEFSWLVGSPDSEEIAQNRSRFETLLEATTPVATRRDALAQRIDAKMAHSQLLTTAKFSENPRTRIWAGTRSTREIRTCLNMLLDG